MLIKKSELKINHGGHLMSCAIGVDLSTGRVLVVSDSATDKIAERLNINPDTSDLDMLATIIADTRASAGNPPVGIAAAPGCEEKAAAMAERLGERVTVTHVARALAGGHATAKQETGVSIIVSLTVDDADIAFLRDGQPHGGAFAHLAWRNSDLPLGLNAPASGQAVNIRDALKLDTLVDAYQDRTAQTLTPSAIADKAKTGDAVAADIVNAYKNRLARALCDVVGIFDPHRILFHAPGLPSGFFADLPKRLLPLLPIEDILTVIGEIGRETDSIALGAACLATA